MYAASVPHKDTAKSQKIRTILDTKLIAAKFAGLTGQNNSSYCQSVARLYYTLDGPMEPKCTGTCNCVTGKTVTARAKTPYAALAEGRSRCTKKSSVGSAGCSCKNCMDYKSYWVPKGSSYEATVFCNAWGFGGPTTTPFS